MILLIVHTDNVFISISHSRFFLNLDICFFVFLILVLDTTFTFADKKKVRKYAVTFYLAN